MSQSEGVRRYEEKEVDLSNLHRHFRGDRFTGRRIGPFTRTGNQREQ